MLHEPYAINSNRIVTPHGVISGCLTIDEGKIAEIKSSYENSNLPLIDASASVVMPGIIDPHVHINEPGREDWEGFKTATQAALVGGTTTIVDMPLNSSPVTVSSSSLKQKISSTRNKLFANVGFWGGIVPNSITDLPGLLDAGVLGIKGFLCHSGIDEFPEVSKKELRAILPLLKEKDLPLLVHAEIVTTGNRTSSSNIYEDYLQSRPADWEMTAIEQMIQLVEEFDTPIHIVHLATAEALPMLKEARTKWPITVETCPHYLYFSSEDIPNGCTEYKCAPPIRDRANNLALWKALVSGDIDFVATDHSPAPPEMKLLEHGDFMQAWGGISSLQYLLPVVWSLGKARGLSLEQLAKLVSTHAAQFINKENSKGKIAAGYDADLVIWDPEARFTVTTAAIEFKHKVTPYLGQKLYGKIQQTIINGHVVYDQGVLEKSPYGKIIIN